jgi:para-nitrobenzyl esterase
MRKTMIKVAVAFLAVGALPICIAPASAQNAPATQASHYSATSTLVGKLLDDPAAAEILKRLIPGVYGNPMFQADGRALTLKDVQQYEPDALSDANLAKIQAEFDKIPAKG